MSVEERVVRLEEFAADVRKYTQFLTEMIRRYDERIDEQEARAQKHDERLDEQATRTQDYAEQLRKLTELAVRSDERMDEQDMRGQEHTEQLRILTELVVRGDERMDTHDVGMTELRAAHAETERRIAALADAQIHTQDALRKLIERDDRHRKSNGDQA